MTAAAAAPPALQADEARALTDAINNALGRASSLLLEAHRGKVWIALGHPSWRAWATAELKISTARAYQLRDLAKIVETIAAAAGTDSTVVENEITERAARRIKRELPKVAAEVNGAVAAGARPVEAIQSAVRSRRTPARTNHPVRRRDRVRRVLADVKVLAKFDANEIAGELGDRVDQLDAAIAFLKAVRAAVTKKGARS